MAAKYRGENGKMGLFIAFLALVVGIIGTYITYLAYKQDQANIRNNASISTITSLSAASADNRVITVTPTIQSPTSSSGLRVETVNNQESPTQPGKTPLPPPATETAIPSHSPGDELYRADWSKDFDGWGGTSSWKTVGGMIVNDGGSYNDLGFIVAPYKPGDHGVTDYVIEAEIRMVGEGPHSFGIIARWEDDDLSVSEGAGYWGGYGTWAFSGSGIGLFLTARTSVKYSPFDYLNYAIDDNWHTYRLEVIGNRVRFLFDGKEISDVQDNQYLEGGEVRLWSYTYQINVKSFRIFVPE